jgi:putative DNA primase/helicase
MTDARTITKALGGKWCRTYGIARCPAHDDHDPSLSICDGEKELIVKCHAGCDWRDVKDELRKLELLDSFLPGQPPLARPPRAPSATQEEEDRKKTEVALRLWDSSVPLQDTLAWRYFVERRQLHIGALDDLSHCLRWYEGLLAVIALMTHPLTGERTGVHRTYLNPDASKRTRQMLGHQGVIRLSPDDLVGDSLGITEGIEDGLRILLGGWSPIWVATCAGGIDRFPVLPAVDRLTIFADEGDPGIKAAEACAERWHAAGRKSVIVHPKEYSNA